MYAEVQHTPHTFDKHTTEVCYPGHIYGTDIKWETAKDILLVKLAHVIQNGWPVQRSDLDQELYVFWIHRLNLSIVYGIIMNGTHIVIPKSQQKPVIQVIFMEQT